MKIAVISGGGSLGAYGVGLLSGLNENYDTVIGVSTGALMAPLIILKKYDKLKEAYTSVTQRDIFSVNPFTKNGNISIPNAIWRLIQNKKTLGETKNLKKLIDKFLTKEDWDELQVSGKEVIVACQAISGDCKVKYFSSKSSSFEDFKMAMWISANAPIACTMVEWNGIQYIDGGLTELVSIIKAIELGATEIDIMIHRTEEKEISPPVVDFFHSLVRMMDIMRTEIENSDLYFGIELAAIKGIKTKTYYLPYKLTENSLIFNKKQMLEWWELGFNIKKEL